MKFKFNWASIHLFAKSGNHMQGRYILIEVVSNPKFQDLADVVLDL